MILVSMSLAIITEGGSLGSGALDKKYFHLGYRNYLFMVVTSNPSNVQHLQSQYLSENPKHSIKPLEDNLQVKVISHDFNSEPYSSNTVWVEIAIGKHNIRS